MVMDIVDLLIQNDPRIIKEDPADCRQLKELAEVLGDAVPAALLRLLGRSNGGEWSFGRFEPSPFLPPAGKCLWSHVAAHYPPSPLIESREFLPFANDYGDGLYCLNFRCRPPAVTLVPFHAQSEHEFSQAAESFEEFLKLSLTELQKESMHQRVTVSIALSEITSPHHPELHRLGVELHFVDRQLIIHQEKQSTFPNQHLLESYQDETRSLFFTLEAKHPTGMLDFGIVNEQNQLSLLGARILGPDGALLSTGSGLQYLQNPRTLSRYPVWSLVLGSPLARGSVLELDLDYVDPPGDR